MPVTNTLGFNAGAFNSKGEDPFWMRLVNSDQTLINGEVWFDGVYMGKVDFAHEQPEEDVTGVSGRTITTEEGNVKTSFTLELLHNDSNIFNFLNSDVQNKYFSILIPHGQGSNNTQKFFYAPLCKIQRGHGTYTLEGGRVQMTIKVLDNPSAFTGSSLSAGSITSNTLWNAALTSSISGAAHVSFISRNV